MYMDFLFYLYFWWRRRELNPRPRILRLRFYMLSLAYVLTLHSPASGSIVKRALISFRYLSQSPSDTWLMLMTASQTHKPIWFAVTIKQLSLGQLNRQMLHRLRLYLCNKFYEIITCSACGSGFIIRVEARTPPFNFLSIVRL